MRAAALRLTSQRPSFCAHPNEVSNSTAATTIPACLIILTSHKSEQQTRHTNGFAEKMWDAVLEQTDGLGLLYAGSFSQFSDHRVRDIAIHVNHGKSFPGLARFGVGPPSEREIGDINLVFAQDRAHAPDHAGDVAVAHIDEVALQRSFGFD